jgi:DNA-3-methyladenine glycosylase I
MSDRSALSRCAWCGSDPLYRAYHDREWGVPSFDDRHLFEMLILEGAQAGLSWLTILRKREGYRAAFDDFDPERIARYDDAKIAELLDDPGIVRNRLKVAAAVSNARAWLALLERGKSPRELLWGYVDGTPRQNAWRSPEGIPSRTAESDAMSRELKRLGFKFVGSTICYAFMQAVGMVNDHTRDCFRYSQVGTTRCDQSPLDRNGSQ